MTHVHHHVDGCPVCPPGSQIRFSEVKKNQPAPRRAEEWKTRWDIYDEYW